MESLLKQQGFRVELDAREEKLSYKMRESVVKKIPYTVIVGDKEKEGNLVSYRKFGTEETISLDKEEFVNEILVAIETRSR